MQKTTLFNVDVRFEMPKAVSLYPQTGNAYVSQLYDILLSPELVRTKANFYDTLEALAKMIINDELPRGTRLSRAAEEHQIYVNKSAGENSLKDVEELKDYFGNNSENLGAEVHTLNCLRTPKGWENGRKDNGTGKYPRKVIETDCSKALKLLMCGTTWKEIGDSVNEVVGELQVPFSDGYVVKEVDNVFGIPIEVDVGETAEHSAPYALCFWFPPDVELDEISGHYDLAVVRGGGMHPDFSKWYLYVAACHGRRCRYSENGFRPVHGARPKIEKFKPESVQQT